MRISPRTTRRLHSRPNLGQEQRPEGASSFGDRFEGSNIETAKKVAGASLLGGGVALAGVAEFAAFKAGLAVAGVAPLAVFLGTGVAVYRSAVNSPETTGLDRLGGAMIATTTALTCTGVLAAAAGLVGWMGAPGVLVGAGVAGSLALLSERKRPPT